MTTTATHTPLTRSARRIRHAWLEMNHAQRRLFEIRTGVSVEPRRPRTAEPARTIEELEHLFRSVTA